MHFASPLAWFSGEHLVDEVLGILREGVPRALVTLPEQILPLHLVACGVIARATESLMAAINCGRGCWIKHSTTLRYMMRLSMNTLGLARSILKNRLALPHGGNGKDDFQHAL